MSQLKIQITYFCHNVEEEVTEELPAKHTVCDKCDGVGTILTPSIANHCYSQEEFEESFCDDDDRDAYFHRGGKYDVVCNVCHGKNVVLVVDRAACKTTEQKEILKAYIAYKKGEEADRREWDAEIRNQDMMGGCY